MLAFVMKYCIIAQKSRKAKTQGMLMHTASLSNIRNIKHKGY
jgi:hypothetical protein